MKKIAALILILALGPSLATAAEIKATNSYFLPAGERVMGNLYVGSGGATVAGTVDGDLYLGAGTALVSGVINGDLVIGGGTVTVTGRVLGDLRAVGGTVTVTGVIDGDTLVAAGSFSNSGKIGRDLDFFGGMLSLGEGTVIEGDVTYRSDREASISSRAVINGQITYDQSLAQSLGVVKEAGARSVVSGFAALFGVWLFLKLIMILFAALVFYWLFLSYLEKIVIRSLTRPSSALASGFIALVVFPALALALLVSVVGLPVAVLVILVYLSLLLAAKLAAGILLGAWGEKLIFKRTSYRVSWQGVVGGTLAFFIIGYIPVIGLLIDILLILLAFGAIIDLLYRRWLARR